MPRRNGTTLVEVLVAIFVMGIGLLAILALFPIGAYRISQAIQDDRMANISLTSDSTATIFNVRGDPFVLPFYQQPQFPGNKYQASPGNPSFPVVVDPIGFRSFGGSATVGGTPVSASIDWIPRTWLSFVANAANPPALNNKDYLCLRYFSLIDDIIFDTVNLSNLGHPYIIPGTTTFERDVRYSWAYVCQMPNVSNPSVVNLTTLAFNRRSLNLGNAVLNPFEYSYSALFNPANNIVVVQYGTTLPPVRAGEWIMDASPVYDSSGKNIVSAHAFFYRVVGINDLGGAPNGTVEYEVQTPLRGWPPPPFVGAPYSGNVIVFEGLAEVFEHGPGRGQ